MWSNALFLLRVRIKGVRFLAILAVWPLTGLLLSLAPLCSLIPGQHGKEARRWLDTALAALWALAACGTDTLVDVDTESKDGQRMQVLLQGMGVGFPIGEGPSAPSESVLAAEPLLARAASCVLAFLLCGWVFGECSLIGALLGGGMLFLLYVLIRPITKALALPVDLLFLGLLTPVMDALLVWWACAWTPWTSMGFSGALCCGLVSGALWMLYSCRKRQSLGM